MAPRRKCAETACVVSRSSSVDRNIIDSQAGSFIADTLAGPKPISFTLDDNGKLACATVDMGAPILEPLEVPTTFGGTETPFGRVAM